MKWYMENEMIEIWLCGRSAVGLRMVYNNLGCRFSVWGEVLGIMVRNQVFRAKGYGVRLTGVLEL